MAELTDFYIQAVGSAVEPCTVEVTDITTYPYHTYDRDEVALALFYDDADFAGPNYTGALLNNPNQFGTPAVWGIGPFTDELISVRVFVVMIWIADVYPAGAVVHYNGQFYYTVAGAGAGDVPGVDVTWTLITVANQAEIDAAFAVFTANPTLIWGVNGWSDAEYQVLCGAAEADPSTLVKTSCYHYTLTDNTGTNDIKYVTVYAYGNSTALISTTLDPTQGTTLEIDLTTYGDGVYLVEFGNDDPAVDASDEWTDTFVIYEYCGVWECYQGLFTAIMCGAYNPCCNTCDPALLEKYIRYREALNMMTGLMLSVIAYINVERVKYLGIFDIDDTREGYISRVSDYLVKLKELASSCGICNPTSEESSIDSPCSNCN